MRKDLGLALAFVATASAAVPAFASDAFNRTSLGSGWVSSGVSISADQLVGSSLGYGYQTSAGKDTAGSAVVYLNGTDLEYGALMIGNVAGGYNAFVKIQAQNGTGQFDHAAFYTGNNDSGDFFTLSSAVSSPATIDAAFCQTTAYMRITSADGVQTYKYNYRTTFGTGGGLGTYGSASHDNNVSYVGGCGAISAAFANAREITHRDAVRDLSR